MFAAEVSGREMDMMRKMGAESQSISHWDQRQFMAWTEKPPITGPKAGPRVAAAAHRESKYGILSRGNISCNVAGPVARLGEPKTPSKNRTAMRPPKVGVSAPGKVKMTKMANVAIYNGFLPTSGISLSGEKTIGPIP